MTVTNLPLARTEANRQTVEQRIERRIQVLSEWLKKGIPLGEAIPVSLTVARLWEDEQLGILPIASPNEFTTTHHAHGKKVKEVAALLTDLKKRYGRPPSARKGRLTSSAAKFDRKELDRQLEAVVSQWHEQRDKRLIAERRADSADSRAVQLLKELKQQEEVISDLRRQLARRDGLRVVE